MAVDLTLIGLLVNSADYFRYLFDNHTYINRLGKYAIWYFGTFFGFIASLFLL